jgi:pyridoxamine 5'-phosphate oxidase
VSAHGHEGLSRRDLDPDPHEQFRRWFADAQAAGIVFPEAMALATADAEGAPAVRHVLMKGFDRQGFVFFTNRESRKGRHLAENPHAAVAFLWNELDRQVCVTGTVVLVSDEESADYFRTRPRAAQLGAWASEQSRPVASRQELDRAFQAAAERFTGEEVPLPPHWGGYRLSPDGFEFWKGREHRLHDRFRYTREGDGWSIERLYP